MSGTRVLCAMFAAVTILGCGSRDVSGPPASPVMTLVQVSANTIFGGPGSEVRKPFSLKVVSYPGPKPVPGVVVRFAVTGDNAAVYSAVSNADGIATLDSIQLLGTPGRYSVTTSAEGTAGYSPFTMLVLSQAPIAVYDLQSMGGQAVTGVPGPESNPQVTGGHYLLFGDGTYLTIYEVNLISNIGEPYRFSVENPQTLDFYGVPANTPGFMPDPKFAVAVGTLAGEKMTLNYWDYFGYEEETYLLRQ